MVSYDRKSGFQSVGIAVSTTPDSGCNPSRHIQCLDHMRITEILRLKEMNLFTYRDIARSVGCSKTTVGEVLSRCKECGLTYIDKQKTAD